MINRDEVVKFASLHRPDISGHLLQIYDTVVRNSPKTIVVPLIMQKYSFLF